MTTVNKLTARFSTLADNSEQNGFDSVKSELNVLIGDIQTAMNRAAARGGNTFTYLFALRDNVSNFIECRGNLDLISERRFEARMLGEDSSYNSNYRDRGDYY